MAASKVPRRTRSRGSFDVLPSTNPLRTVLRRLVLGAFFCAAAVVVLLIGVVVLSVTGLSFDPHGYGTIFGSVLAVVLVLVAQMLWVLYRWLRRGDDRPPRRTDRP